MSRYDRQRVSAQKMVRRFADGRTCTVSYPAVIVGGDRFNPIYGEPVDVEQVPVVLLPKGSANSQDYRPENLLPETTHLAYIAAADLPDRDVPSSTTLDTLGETHNVLSSDCWAPSGRRVLHVLQVSQ